MRLGSFPLLAICAVAVGGDLLTELKERQATEGLGLVKVQSNFVERLVFDASPIKNPRGISTAWISSNGRVVVWSMFLIPHDGCTGTVQIEDMSGKLIWRLPGKAINARMAISNDGKRIAFDGAYKPQGSGGTNTTGLHIADAATMKVEVISNATATSIGWSPDGLSLVYDDQGRILIYTIATRQSRAIASGTAPSWSADGQWIAFRSSSGEAVLVNPSSGKSRVIAEKIRWGVHLSPDSRYAMFSVDGGLLWGLFHGGFSLDDDPRKTLICRLSDGERISGNWFPFQGSDDRGFYWVSDIRTFLAGAAYRHETQGCEPSTGAH
jgi:dipeptidyl aminopeptidase/acylaminoacyl peptidase